MNFYAIKSYYLLYLWLLAHINGFLRSKALVDIFVTSVAGHA